MLEESGEGVKGGGRERVRVQNIQGRSDLQLKRWERAQTSVTRFGACGEGMQPFKQLREWWHKNKYEKPPKDGNNSKFV